jgi:hypothetical protein
MARRIDVELTSSRDDGTWTWRAAGARQPKGEVAGGLLYPGAKVGDVVKVEAEFHLDGIEVTTVFPPKEAKARPDVIELVSRPLRDDELVTSTRSPRREGRDGGRGDDRRRGPRREGARRDDGPRGEGRPRRGGAEQRGDRPPRGPRPEVDQRPKPKRLRPRKAHRDAVMAEVPEEFRPIAERVQAGGIPEVRKALEEQNAAARAEGGPELSPEPILAIAEDLFVRLRAAEWRDRADAALTDLDQLDLRDLRSVVVAADASARDDESRALAEQLRDGLNRRVEADHGQWMADLTAAVEDGRVVRALRLSSRPVKAGAPLPPDLGTKLAGMASAALAPDISQDRWATVLDAVAFSPVRGAITPAGVPDEPSSELRDAVTKLSDRVPAIAALFGIDPAEAGRSRTRTRRARTRKPDGERGAGRPAPAKAAPVAEPEAPDLAGPPDGPAAPDQADAEHATGPGPTDAEEGGASPEPAPATTPDSAEPEAGEAVSAAVMGAEPVDGERPAPAPTHDPDAPAPAADPVAEAMTGIDSGAIDSGVAAPGSEPTGDDANRPG